jgi:hypothetical protein
VSNCSDSEKKDVEKVPLSVSLEPNKKLSKICENNELESESLKEQEIKVDDDPRKILDSITPGEISKLR